MVTQRLQEIYTPHPPPPPPRAFWGLSAGTGGHCICIVSHLLWSCLELFCFLSFVSFVLCHLYSGTHRETAFLTLCNTKRPCSKTTGYGAIPSRLSDKHRTKTQDFTWNVLWQLHMLLKSGDSLSQSTLATKVICQAVLLLKPPTFPRPNHARAKFLHMALRKVIYN